MLIAAISKSFASASAAKQIEQKGRGSAPSVRWKRHVEYWEAIANWAETKEIPVLFFVPNPDGDPMMNQVVRHLESLALSHPFVRVASLKPSDLMETPNDGLDEWVERNLRIPGDGHPNALYHRIMGEWLSRHEVFTSGWMMSRLSLLQELGE